MKVITHSIADYIQMKEDRKNQHWRIDGDQVKFCFNGIWFEKELFNDFYPKVEYVPFPKKGENPDKTLI